VQGQRDLRGLDESDVVGACGGGGDGGTEGYGHAGAVGTVVGVAVAVGGCVHGHHGGGRGAGGGAGDEEGLAAGGVGGDHGGDVGGVCAVVAVEEHGCCDGCLGLGEEGEEGGGEEECKGLHFGGCMKVEGGGMGIEMMIWDGFW